LTRHSGRSGSNGAPVLARRRNPWETAAVTALLRRIRNLSPEEIRARLVDETKPNQAALGTARRFAAELERNSNRGRHGWFARREAMRVVDAIADASPEDRAETEWQLENALEDAVSALVVRDLAPVDVFDTLYGNLARVAAVEELAEDPLADLLGRCQYPLADMLGRFERDGSPSLTHVLFDRPARTLEEIASDLRVTRERIRQIESKAERMALGILNSCAPELKEFWISSLQTAARREEDVIEPFIDPTQPTDPQLRLGRALLRAVGATEPMPFREWDLAGWWTLHPALLTTMARELEALLPCSAGHLDDVLGEFSLGESSALGELVRHHWGQFRFDAVTDSWVRSSARTRDAVWLLLLDEAGPLGIDELSRRTGTTSRALGAQLARDERFHHLKPSGEWALAGAQSQEPPYSTTLEACIDTLRTQGPVTLHQLVDTVRASYPVTIAAIYQCLNHHSIGRLPDGRVDLVERGARRQERTEPRRPPDILVRDGRVTLLRSVDRDLLRGSGLGVSPYLTWFLGLESAPSTRTFEISGYGTLKVRYSVNGSNISSLKAPAELLRAQEGCVLAVTMDPDTDRASIALRCRHHSHTGRLP